MTPTQLIVYKNILNNQPICDKCISNGLGYGHNQNANGHCRDLRDLEYISRINGHCERCNSTKLLNRIVKIMKIKKLRETINQLDLKNDLLEKKVHLVCISVNALTIYNVYTTAVFKISTEYAEKHSKKVNISNEVGSFYPKFNLTIIPLSIFGDRNDFGNKEIFKKHVLDCFESNEKYIKCNKLIFGIENRNDFDCNFFEEMLNQISENYNFEHTKEISICSY